MPLWVDRGAPPILGELLLGSLLGGALGVLGGVVAGQIGVGRWDRLGYALIGSYAGFIVGSSIGVAAVASRHDPAIRFPPTLIFGVLGGAAGIALGQAQQSPSSSGYGQLASLLGVPLLTEILYVNFGGSSSAPPDTTAPSLNTVQPETRRPGVAPEPEGRK